MTHLSMGNGEIYISPVAAEVKFNCAYPSSIAVSTDAFTIINGEATGEATKTGDLKSGFSLDLYTDPAQTTLADVTNVYIGYPVYGDMTWSVTTAQTMVNFYIDECDLVDGEMEIKFIRDNCYSLSVGASQRQEAKMVAASSKFSFVAFTVGDGSRLQMHSTITCRVKLCIATDAECIGALSQSDDECDGKSETAYQYKAVTWN